MIAIAPVNALASAMACERASCALRRRARSHQVVDDGGQIELAVAIGARTGESEKSPSCRIQRMHLRGGLGVAIGKSEVDVYHVDSRKSISYGAGLGSVGMQINTPLRRGVDRSARRNFHGCNLVAGIKRCSCSARTSSSVRPVLSAMMRSTR